MNLNIRAQSAIVEGEVVALDGAGCPIAFQHLMRRFKRIRGIENGEENSLNALPIRCSTSTAISLITLPYVERRQIFAENAGKIPLTKQIVTEKIGEAEDFLKEAISAGHEGLMAKKLDSPYTPGRRGKKWLKIKIVLEPLDLVITAAEYGYG